MEEPPQAVATKGGASNSNGGDLTIDAASHMTKKENGRLKKLRKRARAATPSGGISGVSSAEEWTELEELSRKKQQELTWGPSVLWRQGSNNTETDAVTVEGSDHRDLLHRLVANVHAVDESSSRSNSNSKKRKRDNDQATEIPGWACLHNSAAVEHVAVLEVHVQDPQLLEAVRQQLSECINNQDHNRNVLTTSTRWFQGSQPKSISGNLMYASKSSKSSGNVTESNAVTTLGDLAQALTLLTVTTEQWEREGYPETAPVAKESENVALPKEPASDNILSPSSISLADAMTLVKNFTVQVVGNDAKTEELAPFVERSESATTAAAADDSLSSPRIFAVDCEMVMTTAGSEIARMTLMQVVALDSTDQQSVKAVVLWDEVIQPRNSVVDYVTTYSGMTPAILKNVETRVEQVQAALLQTIAPHDIVIGHSPENDLRAARWIHRRVIDTSLLFRAENARFKYSLRHLAAALLKTQIQRPDQPHCSEEDAEAALQLAVRRAMDGPAFGLKDKTQLNRLTALAQCGTTVCVGPSDWLQQHVTSQPNAVHALACETVNHPNHKAVAAWLGGSKRRARLVWGNLTLSELKDSDAVCNIVSGLLSSASISSATVLAVALQGGYERAASMTKQRRVRQDPRTTVGWTTQEEDEWFAAIEASRHGSTFWISAKS
jgi:hypothetical protein